ncbi:MAG: hypothetical protein ACYTHM_11950 [Planctomycetota bacterium]|jgi:hypothetical protein
MKTIFTLTLVSVLLSGTAFADAPDRSPLRLLDLLEPELDPLPPDLHAITQRGGLPGFGAPKKPQLRLFPGPKFISINFGLSWCPIVGGGAADDSSPHLASYRKYWDWDASFGVQASLHLHVLPTANAYVSIGAVHHPCMGKQDWGTYLGPNHITIRYQFDPLYIFPIEFGGKGYLPLKAPPGLRFISPNREAPLLYLKIGAGPAFVSTVNIKYRRYINGALHSTVDEVWWPAQSVLNVHVAIGLEWDMVRPKKTKSLLGFGLFAEVGYRAFAGPVVTEYPDTSDFMQTITLTIGVTFP